MQEDYREVLDEFYATMIKEVMEKRLSNIPLLEQDTEIKDVIASLRDKHHVWIIDVDSEELVGVITEKDVLGILAHPEDFGYKSSPKATPSLYHGTAGDAESVMIKKVITCNPEATIKDAITTMTKYNVRRLPVIDENKKILGEVTLMDLINQFMSIVYWHGKRV
jgi:CBS domain-containing protein